MAAPVRSAPFCHAARAGSAGSRGTGSQVQSSLTVRALYPRTVPEGILDAIVIVDGGPYHHHVTDHGGRGGEMVFAGNQVVDCQQPD